MEMSEITIAGKKFPVRNPYEGGHSLTDGEASALNQLRHENVRNNMAKTVKTWDGTEDGLLAEVDKYDAEYEFNVRREGEARVPSDPISTEAKAIAREAIKQALERAGQKADAKQMSAAIEKLLSDEVQGPKFRQVAEARVAERKRLASEAMQDIDISGISAPAAPEQPAA